MRITILTDNPKSWIMPYVERLKEELSQEHDVEHVYKITEISHGDILFLLSCESIVPEKYLTFHRNNIVAHPSKLPQGKGHSPLAWQIPEGQNSIPVSLFEATKDVDAGDVYQVEYIELKGHELNDEIKHLQGSTTMDIVKRYVAEYKTMKGIPQSGQASFYKKRSFEASELSVDKTIEEQFNLLRVVDNERYPAFFRMHGQRYIIKIYKENEDDSKNTL